LWQGSNRIQADKVDIDRQKGRLEANGKVVSQFIEKAKPGTAKSSPLVTVIRAPEMIYVDSDRVANYHGGVTLSRPGLVVVSKDLQAYLRDSESDSSLDRAIADGAVKIVQSTAERQRTGTSEHAEYYTADGKVILQQGEPTLVDSKRGTTKGQQLTYFSNNDRLLVDGVETKPAVSNILRK
jgi:lipopolysaccharide export system protein LptA